jgi:hypothetical protein
MQRRKAAAACISQANLMDLDGADPRLPPERRGCEKWRILQGCRGAGSFSALACPGIPFTPSKQSVCLTTGSITNLPRASAGGRPRERDAPRPQKRLRVSGSSTGIHGLER